MGAVSRGIKNAFRNTIRTISITFILALSIAMSLIMLLSLKTVQSKIDAVKSSIGNTITVSPAGVRGFEGGGTLLTEQNATDVTALAHVSKVTTVLTDRLELAGTTSNNPAANSASATTLTSPIQPGSFGNRQRQSQTGSSSTNVQAQRTFAMPVMLTGINDMTSISAMGLSQLDIKSGSLIDGNSGDNVAMLGTDLASKNNLAVGGNFQAYGQTVTVAAIFDAGSTFSNGSLIMPIKTVQTLSAQAGQINTMIVQTDSIDTLSSVSDAIKNKLGSSAVDVIIGQDTSNEAIAPLQNIKTISLYSLIGSLAAGSIIILLTMIMIVRERRREIGVLKAIGSSNIKIMLQFVSESLALTLLASTVGIVLGMIFSNPILKVLVTNSAASNSNGGQGNFARGAGGAAARFGGRALGGVQNTLQNIHAVVGWEMIIYGILAAVTIAIIGSAIPAFFIAKVRPAEAMRAE